MEKRSRMKQRTEGQIEKNLREGLRELGSEYASEYADVVQLEGATGPLASAGYGTRWRKENTNRDSPATVNDTYKGKQHKDK